MKDPIGIDVSFLITEIKTMALSDFVDNLDNIKN